MKKLSLLAFSAWLLLLSQAVPAQWNWATVVPTYPLVGPSFTGQLKGPVTADCSAPTYAFTGDLNTGLTATAANTLNFCADGTSRLAITASAITPALPIASPTFTGTGGSGYPIVLASSWAAINTPADTTEDVLATITIPAGAMGANGQIRILTSWTLTNSGNEKTARIRFSGAAGTLFLNTGGLTTQTQIVAQTWISNRAAANSQIGGSFNISQGNAVGNNISTTASVDTAAATTLVITGQKASAGETLTLDGYTVELIKP